LLGQSPKSTKRVADADMTIMRAVGMNRESFIVAKEGNESGVFALDDSDYFIAYVPNLE
jgi:hypothetical protein